MLVLLLVLRATRLVAGERGADISVEGLYDISVEGVYDYDIGQTGIVPCRGQNTSRLDLDKLRSVTFYKDSVKKILS